MYELVLPLIYGYYEEIILEFSDTRLLKFGVIAWRSRFYVGTRYFAWGIDHLGNVANEVETE